MATVATGTTAATATATAKRKMPGGNASAVMKANKVCRVCGDKAIGFNFNSLTCESCKSFFRRNALKYEQFRCRKEGSCLIDFVTRKCCTRCRLDRCFATGMRKELICRKLEAMEANNQGHHHNNNHTNTNINSPSSTSASPPPPTASQSAMPLDSSQECQQYVDHHPLSTPNVDRLLEEAVRAKISQCSLLYPIAPGEAVLTKASVPVRRKYVVELHSHELERLREIEQATDCAAFFKADRMGIIGEATNLIFALNCAELYIRKAIKFCKSFAAFRVLSQDDQLTLIKGFFAELMIIRLSFVFDRERDGWPVIINDVENHAVFVKMNLLYESKTRDHIFYSREYSVKFQEAMEADQTLSDIILTLRLFTPREGLLQVQGGGGGGGGAAFEFIHYQSHLYQRLLHRYLEAKYRSVAQAEEKMARLRAILDELDQPAKDILESMFVEVDSSQLSLVLSELYKNK